MSRKKYVTEAEKLQIIELHQSGRSIRGIAEEVSRSQGSVRKALRMIGKADRRMARAGRGPAKTSSWQGHLTKLVERIRETDPGVTFVEVDVESGHYTVNRTTSERGELS